MVELSRTGLGRATIGKNDLVAWTALLSEELRKGQWALRGSRLPIRIHVSIRTLHDTKDVTQTHRFTWSSIQQASFPSRPQTKGKLSMEPSLMFTFYFRQSVRNRKTSKQKSDVTRQVF